MERFCDVRGMGLLIEWEWGLCSGMEMGALQWNGNGAFDVMGVCLKTGWD